MKPAVRLQWIQVAGLLLLLFPLSLRAQVPAGLLEKAIQEREAGQYDSARVHLEAVLRADPRNARARHERGMLFLDQGQNEAAVKWYTRLVKEKDTHPRYFQMLGQAWRNLGEPRRALSFWAQGQKRFPQDGGLFWVQGKYAQEQGDVAAAHDFFLRGAAADASWAGNFQELALHYLKTEDRLWGAMYGEIFCLMSPPGTATSSMGLNVYNVWSTAVIYIPPREIVGKLALNPAKYNPEIPRVHPDTMPFAIAFEQAACKAFVQGLTFQKRTLQLSELPHFRREVLREWDRAYARFFPDNPLFAFWRELDASPHFEIYHYWLMAAGESFVAQQYLEAHREEFAAFSEWMQVHRPRFGGDTRFVHTDMKRLAR